MSAKEELMALNQNILEMEQTGDETAQGFFETILSELLIFRRASGKVIGKYGQEGFLAGIKNNPFKSRSAEDMEVTVIGSRALVTLMVIGVRKDDNSVHRYRNIRFFNRTDNHWVMDAWYNEESP